MSKAMERANPHTALTPQILEHYQNRFTNILVDEFQDTNRIQYQSTYRLDLYQLSLQYDVASLQRLYW